jgi:hypothetical protein
MELKYIGSGWFSVLSERSGNVYFVFPRDAFCSCPSRVVLCRHLQRLFSRLLDGGIGIDGLDLGDGNFYWLDKSIIF